MTDRNRGVLRGTLVARGASNYMVNTGSHGSNTPFEKELWTMYSSHSGRICCKQWAKGLCVRRYWPLYAVNVPVPSQAVCGSDRTLGRWPRLRLGQVESGQVWTSRRLGCHIGPRQEVEFGSEHHSELRGKRQHNTEMGLTAQSVAVVDWLVYNTQNALWT